MTSFAQPPVASELTDEIKETISRLLLPRPASSPLRHPSGRPGGVGREGEGFSALRAIPIPRDPLGCAITRSPSLSRSRTMRARQPDSVTRFGRFVSFRDCQEF